MARLNLQAFKDVQRKVFTQSAMLGIAVTLLVVILDWNGDQGNLKIFEGPLFDERAKLCQFFQPAPTDKLVHIDITDEALQHIGSWPWPRDNLARILREMQRAGAKAVAFDIIFAEPQAERYQPVRARPQAAKQAAIFEGQFQRVIDDDEFAKAVADFGNVILPASFDVRAPDTKAETAARLALKKNIYLSEDGLWEHLNQIDGLDVPPTHEFTAIYKAARNRALYELIAESIDRHMADSDADGTADVPKSNEAAKQATISLMLKVRDEVLPGIETNYEQVRLWELFSKKEYPKALSFYHLRKFSRPAEEAYLATPVNSNLAPIPTLVKSQNIFGFIDNLLTDHDGKVRKLALFEEFNGRLYPNMSLALACAALEVSIKDIEIGDDVVVIPTPDGRRIEVPVFRQHSSIAERECGLFTYFPWFGDPNVPDGWKYIYDRSDGDTGEGHMDILKVWELVELQNDKMQSNTESIRDVLFSIFQIFDPTIFDRLQQNPIPFDNADGYLNLLDAPWIKSELEDNIPGLIGDAHKLNDADFAELMNEVTDEEERYVLTALRAGLRKLPDLRKELLNIHQELDRRRANLRRSLQGKAVFVGWAAQGRMDDIPTSLHATVPGVVAHGVMFNAILTGDFWEKASPWVARLFTIFFGLIITLAVAKLTPPKALAVAITLAIAYLIFNGIVLFDLNNQIVGLAAPLLAILAVWSSGTVLRFIVERREKAFITKRFRSYVDPALVNFVMENPDRASFAGEVREMSVVFTDLQGFTSISEKLQEATVPLLNSYMERMVPIIRERDGYVNKFLGDGIMFFYGAPKKTTTHAVDAVATALRMQEAMVPFNEKLLADDLPSVVMRVGISTGNMVVGDAGSHDAADYTVLGDAVNFAARLESGNKYIGTRIMISELTAELVKDKFLMRPLARLQVVGKTQGMVAYEPLNFIESATDEQKKLATMTTRLFDQYKDREFDQCLETLIELDELVGGCKLTSLYREHCEQYLVKPPAEDFDGTIVLTSK